MYPGEDDMLIFSNKKELGSNGAMLLNLIKHQVQANPDHIALEFGDENLTYRQVDARSNQISRILNVNQIGPDSKVGICLKRSSELVVGILGILKSGAAYVPLDPQYPQERIRFMITDSKVKLCIVSGERPTILAGNHFTQILSLRDQQSKIAAMSTQSLNISIHEQTIAYCIYTSGSTGTPKGVLMSHGSLWNHMSWMVEQFGFCDSDRFLLKTPFSFDASIWEILAPFLAGGTLVIGQPDCHKDIKMLIELIKNQRITILQVVPSLLNVLLDRAEFSECTSLRLVFSGGETLSSQLVKRFHESMREVRLYNLYGPTEACIDATFHPCTCNNTHNVPTMPIGLPIANTQIFVLNDYLEPVPIGVIGELYIGGVQLAQSYNNRPDLTAEQFIPYQNLF